MAEFPALPLWTDSYLADASHLSDAEHGRYLLMLIHLWRMPECRFPNDDVWLGRKFSCTREQVAGELRPLIREFFSTDGNWLHQKRMTRERTRVMTSHQKQSDRAKSRWEKEKASSRGNASPAMQPYPYPEPLNSIDKPNGLSPPKSPKGDFGAFWLSCPRKVGKRAAQLAYARGLARGASPETIQAGMQRYAASRAGQPVEYTVHPATWLNQDRWLDEAGASSATAAPLIDNATKAEELANLKRMGIVP